MDKLKLKIGAIRGVCNLCLDKIYFYEKEEITKEKLEEEIDAEKKYNELIENLKEYKSWEVE